jgi:flavin reductase (DIM6/NTAB) family NADH-FMN oxidoreductase RutF
MPDISTLDEANMFHRTGTVAGLPADQLAQPPEFRQLMGSFPTGVSVITTIGDGGPRGMTCSSLTSVCLEPPILAVCLHTTSSTLSALTEIGRFAVNLLHARGERAAQVFASAVADRFALVAFAIAECRVVSTTELGDHTVVFGQVGSVSQSSASPLVYGRRSFRSWDELRSTGAESAA